MKLVRFVKNNEVTIGQITYEDLQLFTVERPWLDNAANISCIPDGTYTVKRVNSPRFGKRMWEITEVRDRTHILIHVANYPHNVEGCIGLGTGVYSNLGGVSSSRIAIRKFYEKTKELEEFELVISTEALT